jgi:hypothetical protein
MKVLCINPPVYTFLFYNFANHYPSGLYNVATHFKNLGNDVDILDMHREYTGPINSIYKNNELWIDNVIIQKYSGNLAKCGNFENENLAKGILRFGLGWDYLEDKLTKNKYDLIVIQCTFTYYWQGAHEAIDICKKIQPNTEVWFGGIYPSICRENAKKSKADRIIPGRIDEEEKFISTDLSLLGYKPMRIQVQTSYGCKNSCRYCAVTRLEGRNRIERPVDDVISFIRSAIKMGYKSFRFLDSNILDNWDNHFKKILNEIILLDENLDITAYGGVETGMLNDEKARMMKDAGFSKITIPLESSDGDQLVKWGRKNNLDKFKESVEIARKYFNKESTTAFIMVGYPGQKIETAMESIKICNTVGCKPDCLAFTPIPGTYKEFEESPLESLHPMLWPCAWSGFTARQMEDFFSDNVDEFQDSLIDCTDISVTNNMYATGPAVYE